jgi:hypothetical protein
MNRRCSAPLGSPPHPRTVPVIVAQEHIVIEGIVWHGIGRSFRRIENTFEPALWLSPDRNLP